MRRKVTTKVLLMGLMMAALGSLWAAAEVSELFLPEAFCDGIGDGTWNGCRGTGCHVCQEKLTGYDCYFDNHPECTLNTTCAGYFFDYDAACPPPTEADRCGAFCDGIGDGTWNGCRGTGCHVCQEKLTGYDCYFDNHPECTLNTTCAGYFFDCDAACPPPTEADRCGATCDGIGDGTWNGCRGTGCHVCQEKLAGYDCYFDNHPECTLNTTCFGYFYDCDAACPQPTEADHCSCTADACGTCSRPAIGVDADGDGVPDRLEYDLAHKFFPGIRLQHQIPDIEQAYLANDLAIPFTVEPLDPRSICNETFECLEIKFGIAYKNDCGDFLPWESTNHCDTGTGLPNGGHVGDSEFYAALVMRNTAWPIASGDSGRWTMIRDFTAAHWKDTADSSKYGAYGYCPPDCHMWDSFESSCRSHASQCGWFPGLCSGGVDDSYRPCSFYDDEPSCFFAGGSCHWIDSRCFPRVDIGCYRTSPLSGPRTTYAAEGKHALYHTISECNNGGFDIPILPDDPADNCPVNQYNMRGDKDGLLQNVGNFDNHSQFDILIQHPEGCRLYDVWKGEKFANSTAYSEHFTTGLFWDLP